MIQAELKKDLAEETARNKDDIMHLEMLRKHYEEREKAYDVPISLVSSFTFITHSILQEVQAAAKEAVKDLAANEKQEVGLQERRKHAGSKAKKLKKSLQDVS